jgi:hypothetical protein
MINAARMNSKFRGLSAGALAVALTACLSSAAWAQVGFDSPGMASSRAKRTEALQDKPTAPAPDAIPGAAARAPVAPATKPVGDLQPTEALFDAINRGDIAAARDALNRGADLNGVNILGMTPMELSVDLGRNDISFLLLSMRGEDSGRGSRAMARGTPASGPAAKTGKPAVTAKAAPAKPATRAPVAANPVATPNRFASDGGAPLPNAGFLGFGSRSASN